MTFGFGMGFPRASSAAGGPSLNLQFAGSTTLDPSITFTRASSGSYYDSTGTLRLAPVNLALYSEQFDNAYWAKSAITVTVDAATAPNGTTTAEKLIPNTSNVAGHSIVSSVSPSSGTYTYSVYAKAAGYTRIMLFFNGSNLGYGFDLSAGTTFAVSGIAAASDFSITFVGNGWYRCTLTSSSATRPDIYVLASTSYAAYAGNGTDGVLIWGAQLEQSTTAATYIPTTGTVNGAPRLDYNPSTLQPLGLLIEEARTNLLTYSSEFDNAAWAKTETTVAANVIGAPDGTTNADKFVPSINALSHYIQNTVTSTTAQFTASLYVKLDGSTVNKLTLYPGGASTFVNFNMALLTVGLEANAVSASITSIGNGWYRLIATWASSVTVDRLRIYASSGANGASATAGDGTSGIYIWGAQLEAGAFATSYVPSTNTFTSRATTGTFYGSNGLIQTAAINVARYNYNPANLTIAPTLLLEAAATNLLTYSEQFDNAVWTKTAAGAGVAPVVSPNAATAPDGNVTADRVQLNCNGTTAADRSILVKTGITITNGIAYNGSVWVKATATSDIGKQLRFFGDAMFTALIITLTGAWQRVSTNGLSTGVTGGFGIETRGTYTTNTTADFYIWGAQLEAGSGATSYIPTVASQVTRDADLSTSAAATRAQDVAVISTLTPWFNATEGTIYAAFNPYAVTSDSRFLEFNDGSASNRILLYGNAPTYYSQIRVSGVDQASMQSVGSFIANATTKQVTAYKANDFAFDVNGGAVQTDTSGTVPVVNQMRIGGSFGTSFTPNGTISRISYYPRRLSNTELQSLTT